MNLKAVIFDLNGTVLDDELVYAEAYAQVLRDLGAKLDNFMHIKGIGVQENWPILLKKYKINSSLGTSELARRTNENYLMKLDEIQLMPGFVDFVENLRKSEILTALASSNTWLVVEKIFDKFKIENLFDSVTTGEEVAMKKPSPEIFLLSAEKLNIEPVDCLVFEDADTGIEAALSAGMSCVAIKNKNPKATLTINDYNELLKNEIIENMVNKISQK